jgi:ribosomal protein L30/L7E
MSKLAAVLIRGRIGARQEVKDTLDMLRLRKKHARYAYES